MDHSVWIDRVYQDESLTDNLDDRAARALLQRLEQCLRQCRTENEARGLIARARAINRSGDVAMMDRLCMEQPYHDHNSPGEME